MAAGLDVDAFFLPIPDSVAELLARLFFADFYFGAAPEQEMGQGFSRLSQAHDQDFFVAQIHVYLNFRVARLNRAKMMPKIQNLTTTFSSGHPMSSKWWWRGAILKILFPLENLK